MSWVDMNNSKGVISPRAGLCQYSVGQTTGHLLGVVIVEQCCEKVPLELTKRLSNYRIP